MNPDFVVLAAGKGSRMLGPSPKVLLPVGGRAMVQRVLDTVAEIDKSRAILVLGDQAKEVKKALNINKNTKVVNGTVITKIAVFFIPLKTRSQSNCSRNGSSVMRLNILAEGGAM